MNHGLRDPKGEPKDDYGTYRSLDVALAAGGGKVYTGPNKATQGGVLSQLKDSATVELEKGENLFLVSHGSKNLIGVLGPKSAAQVIARITPDGWKGKIFSLNCWSAYRPEKDTPSSAAEILQKTLAENKRETSVSGPVGRSIRHRDWLGGRGFAAGHESGRR